MVTEKQIRELAHSIWEQEGRPNGKDVEHYFRAKKKLEERESQFIQLTSAPPKIELEPPAQPIALGTPTQIQGYCLKCRSSREIKDAKTITMKNGKPAIQGICPVCGTKIFKIGKS